MRVRSRAGLPASCEFSILHGVCMTLRVLEASPAPARFRSAPRRSSNSAARLVEPAELLRRSPRHARQQVVIREGGLVRSVCRRRRGRPRGRTPCLPRRRGSIRRPATASARQRAVERGDARPIGLLGVRARAWTRGDRSLQRVRACAPPSRSARASAARPRRMSRRSQRARFCSSSNIGSPDGPMRARERDAWISMSATSPCTSGSVGASSARCGQAAARLRTAPGASSRRRPSPSTLR